MGEQSRDKRIRFLGKTARVGRIGEYVFAVLEQGHIRMHSAAIDAEYGLGHERRVQTVLLREGFYCELEGHDVVGGGQRVGVFEIDLVLSGGDFVM